MLRIRETLLLGSIALIFISSASCSEKKVLIDRSFDLWCGDSLCDWEVTAGKIMRASTWNERDYGVELVGSWVILSTVSGFINNDDCLLFELIAKIEPGVKLTFEIDFWNDGSVDYSKTVSQTDWEPLQFSVSKPAVYDDNSDFFRITLRKKGNGNAVLARLRQNRGYVCKPMAYKYPQGVPCDSNGDCLSGKCGAISPNSENYQEFSCGDCQGDQDCDEGSICGLHDLNYTDFSRSLPPRSVYPSCVKIATVKQGQACVRDEECASGFCDFYDAGDVNFQVASCQECRNDDDCVSDKVCGLSLQYGKRIALCVNPGLDQLNDLCRVDSECGEGLRCSGSQRMPEMLSMCVECYENAHCKEGEICNLSGECIERRSSELGEVCLDEDECESGICAIYRGGSWGVCSECYEDEDCSKGKSCVYQQEYRTGGRTYYMCIPKE